MMVHKLVIKCGIFAVLVDFHVRPEDSSKDTTWFSDQKREEICMLLRDTIDSRVKQYLKARKCHGQGKQEEYLEGNPLSLKADGFRVAAYFVKRRTNLRCIGGQQHSELRVFPDRFVICVTRLESSPPLRKEVLSPGTSDYFGKSVEGEKCRTPLTQQEKRTILKTIVKRTKAKKAVQSQLQPSKDTMTVYLGSLCSDRE
ncbi:protein SLX4IP isoform X2 [Tiliqua scincoides]|uniref:protein SLX4IP isoform X2 n=1 Tax=Tiliqua scincoides TaxID=71010 RepID=UPI0034621F76